MKSLTDPGAVRRWLKKRLGLQILEYLFTSFFALLIGIVFLAVIFAFCYLVSMAVMAGVSAFFELFFEKRWQFSFHWPPLICVLVLALLFAEDFRARRDHLGSYQPLNPVIPIVGFWGTLIALFTNRDDAGRILSDLLFAGPRLTMWSLATLLRALRLTQTDLHLAAEILAILTRQFHRTSFTDLSKMLLGQDPMTVLRSLEELDCLLFLVRPPAGVILTMETRAELIALLGRQANFESPPPPEDPPPAAAPVEDAEYYELLGVAPTASLTEIKRAYRQRIKQCHPDKFAGRGAEFRQLAEERAKALNEAYAILTAKLASGGNTS